MDASERSGAGAGVEGVWGLREGVFQRTSLSLSGTDVFIAARVKEPCLSLGSH